MRMNIPLTTIAKLAIGLLLLTAVGVQTVRLADERADHQTAVARYQGERVEAIKLTAKAETEQREEFERRIKEKDRAIEQAQAKQAIAAAAARNADAAGKRLRESTEGLVERARQACRGTDAGQGSTPADDPIGVLADVLGRIDQRAGSLAKYADAARIAGEACERSYDSLTPEKKERRADHATHRQ